MAHSWKQIPFSQSGGKKLSNSSELRAVCPELFLDLNFLTFLGTKSGSYRCFGIATGDYPFL